MRSSSIIVGTGRCTGVSAPLAGTVLLVSLLACSHANEQPPAADAGTDGAPDVGIVEPPDASPDAPADASPDAPEAPPLTMVKGHVHTNCRQVPADVDLPTDLSTSIIQALIPDDSPSGHRLANGRGDANGGFQIDDVPDGITYTLRINDDYYVTDQHVIELRTEAGTRCVPRPVLTSSSTPVTFQLTGMTPFSENDSASDQLFVDGPSVGYFSDGFASEVRAGDTSIDTVYDWQNGFDGAPLVDARLGDELFVVHLRVDKVRDPNTQRTHQGLHIVDVFHAADVTLHDGAPATITGAFQPAPLTRTASFSLDRSLFDAGYDGTSVPTSTFVDFLAFPRADDIVEALAEFRFTDVSRSTSLVETIADYRFSDPFPASWQHAVDIVHFRRRYVQLPSSTGVGFTTVLQMHTEQQVADTGSISTLPIVLPPGGAKIRGVDLTLGGNVAFDGHRPVNVTWNAVPSSTYYRLEVGLLDPFDVLPLRIATFVTTATSLDLPADLFTDGGFFVFTLGAGQAAAAYSAGHLVPRGLSRVLASQASGRFRFTASCGDGSRQSGEDCDTGGESATCNIDCTAPHCGDGLRNTAAGEACDTVRDTPSCDDDCTLPVCGDHHVNKVLEDCDDGNATDDGNGCDANCKFNNVCGNHIVEAGAEACDEGGVDTAACDADCTAPSCGDGHINPAAGERCDDGNDDDSDHCSNDCKVQ